MSEEERKFIKETVKEKPINKKRIAVRFIVSALSGAIFAVVACGIIALLLPRWTNINEIKNLVADVKNTDNQKNDIQGLEKKEESTDSSSVDTDSDANSDSYENKSQDDKVNNEKEKLSSEDMYSEAVSAIYKVGARADKSVVKVTGVTDELDLFNSPYENGKAGCGLIVGSSDDGFFVLAESRLIDDSNHIRIEFGDGVACEAMEYASDELTGLSIIMIPADNIDKDNQEKYKVADLALSFSPRIGQELIAVGAPQGKLHGIVRGNVTASGEQISTPDTNYAYFQTDINKTSETEGYLCNLKGEIVGFIVENLSNEMPKECICAVAVSEIKNTIDKLMAGEDMSYVGILFNVVTEKISSDYYIPRGIYVKEAVLDSPAMRAGLMPGDIITHIENEEINTEAMYENTVRKLVPEKKTDFTIRRQSAEGYVELHYEITPSIKR